MNIYYDLIVGGLASMIATMILACLHARNHRLFFGKALNSKRRYLNSLRALMIEMPFIYRDGPAMSVKDDYVDIDYEFLDPCDLNRSKDSGLGNPFDKMKFKKKVLILGAAGIGKTTFQRHTLLNILDKKRPVQFLYKKEKPLPIFIPLKAVDNSRPNPIYRYITENITYFSGKKGYKRLERYANRGRLFLFLDGYDELAFVANENWAKAEIECIFGTSENSSMPIYDLLRKGRVWLASRKEFFVNNAIRLNNRSGKDNVLPVIFQGIGSSRLQLIENIFEKYNSRPNLKQQLDSELFLDAIDNLEDDEVVAMSYNPLFLTIMCYLSCQEIINQSEDSAPVVGDIETLIVRCVKALLLDLDKVKVRNLPKARAKALLNRRSQYSDEKFDFLTYFSAQLFLERKNVFTETEIKSKAILYFEKESKSNSRNQIVKQMQKKEKNNPSFSTQLIYNGVFIVSAEKQGSFIYDFPHRRFKEVLAALYFENPKNYMAILIQAREAQALELFLLFKKRAIFSDPNFHLSTLEIILDAANTHPKSMEYFKAADGLLLNIPTSINLDAPLVKFFSYQLTHSQPLFLLPEKMLSLIKNRRDLVKASKETALISLREKQPERFLLSLLIYQNLSDDTGLYSSLPMEDINAKADRIFEVWAYFLLRYKIDVKTNLDQLVSTNTELMDRLVYPVALNASLAENSHLSMYIQKFSEKQLTQLIVCSGINNKPISNLLPSHKAEEADKIKHIQDASIPEKYRNFDSYSGDYFIVTMKFANDLSKKILDLSNHLIGTINLPQPKQSKPSKTKRKKEEPNLVGLTVSAQQKSIERLLASIADGLNKSIINEKVITYEDLCSAINESVNPDVFDEVYKLVDQLSTSTSFNPSLWRNRYCNELLTIAVDHKGRIPSKLVVSVLASAELAAKKFDWSPLFEAN